jgi:hypothetical protein
MGELGLQEDLLVFFLFIIHPTLQQQVALFSIVILEQFNLLLKLLDFCAVLLLLRRQR